MVQLSKEMILEWQKTFKRKWGVEYTFEEASEAANNLIGFFDLLLECDMKQNPQLYKKQKNDSKRSS